MKLSSWKSALASPAGRALLALLLVIAAGAVFNAQGAFFKVGTHRDTLRQASVYGILACGMTLVIVSGGIDLAVGSILALTAVCAAKMAISIGEALNMMEIIRDDIRSVKQENSGVCCVHRHFPMLAAIIARAIMEIPYRACAARGGERNHADP